MNMSEFLHMGGYAFFVWMSYGLTLLVLVANLLTSLARASKQRRELQGKLRREGV